MSRQIPPELIRLYRMFELFGGMEKGVTSNKRTQGFYEARKSLVHFTRLHRDSGDERCIQNVLTHVGLSQDFSIDQVAFYYEIEPCGDKDRNQWYMHLFYGGKTRGRVADTEGHDPLGGGHGHIITVINGCDYSVASIISHREPAREGSIDAPVMATVAS